MFYQFFKYFITYLFFAKSRQKLLFLAIIGLLISSFALLVLQSTMGGLQHKLKTRSKNVLGEAVILFRDEVNPSRVKELFHKIRSYGKRPFLEYEIELLMRNENYISPVILHGVDMKGELPGFLKNVHEQEVIVPYDLSIKLHLNEGENVSFISPIHVDALLGDIPRSMSLIPDRFILTDVPEVDLYHSWTNLSKVQNLIRKRAINKIRIYSKGEEGVKENEMTDEEIYLQIKKDLKSELGDLGELQTWEKQNATLVWALKLETTVMVFLFTGMSMLVSLCITSGLVIFFDKVKNDLASFWILGASQKKLGRASFGLIGVSSFFSVICGIILALIFLKLLDRYGIEIMPDIFVDRKIPIHITLRGIFISFIIPYTVSMAFSITSIIQFKRDGTHLDRVRSIG
jgi:lipoprotein-releasing system permease protein